MHKREVKCVQHLARRGNAGEFGQARILLFAIGCVARQWKTEMLKMNPDLMRAPRV